MARQSSSNKMAVPQAALLLEEMKSSIAQEFGVRLGPDTPSRANGSVGGEMTKRLVHMSREQFIH